MDEFTETDWVQLKKEMSIHGDSGKPFTDKRESVLGRNPLIPAAGVLLTSGFLVMGLLSFVSQKHGSQQAMMRGRIAAQGFTFASMVGAVVYSINSKLKNRIK